MTQYVTENRSIRKKVESNFYKKRWMKVKGDAINIVIAFCVPSNLQDIRVN